jgi:hypothetical protein
VSDRVPANTTPGQTTARPGASNAFNLTLRPSVELSSGTVVVIAGVAGVVPIDPDYPPPDGAAAGAVGVPLAYGASAGAIFGGVAALDVAAGTLTLTTAVRWPAGAAVTALFALANGAEPRAPAPVTVSAAAPTAGGINPLPPVLAAAEEFGPEECERRPFFVSTIALLGGEVGGEEDSRFRCVQWDPVAGRLSAVVAAGRELAGANPAASPAELAAAAAAVAFRLSLQNGGAAQPQRAIMLQVALPGGAAAPAPAAVAAAADGSGGPLQIRIWQTAASAQVGCTVFNPRPSPQTQLSSRPRGPTPYQARAPRSSNACAALFSPPTYPRIHPPSRFGTWL